MEAQVLWVGKYGKFQICTLKFDSGCTPFIGMLMTGEGGLIIRVIGIVVTKQVVDGVREHPCLQGSFDCRYQVVSDNKDYLKEGMTLFFKEL